MSFLSEKPQNFFGGLRPPNPLLHRVRPPSVASHLHILVVGYPAFTARAPVRTPLLTEKALTGPRSFGYEKCDKSCKTVTSRASAGPAVPEEWKENACRNDHSQVLKTRGNGTFPLEKSILVHDIFSPNPLLTCFSLRKKVPSERQGEN